MALAAQYCCLTDQKLIPPDFPGLFFSSIADDGDGDGEDDGGDNGHDGDIDDSLFMRGIFGRRLTGSRQSRRWVLINAADWKCPLFLKELQTNSVLAQLVLQVTQ